MNLIKISLPKEAFQKIDDESINEYYEGKDGNQVLRCKKLRGLWVIAIVDKINEFEHTDYKMLGKNGRINRSKKQAGSKFF